MSEIPDDLAAIESCRAAYDRIHAEMAKVVVGQREVIDDVLMSLFCDSHILLVGVPGLAKTLLIATLAKVLKLDFKRVQFTPDLLPGDITGSEVIEEDRATGRREFRFVNGPVFTNLLLADEINRTPPKTQAALLQAMQEREVSAGRQTLKLPRPFLVMATQNPLEQEGTYPLPEAQLDRFLLHIKVGYPSGHEEWEIARRVTAGKAEPIASVMSGEEILGVQKLIQRVPVSDQVLGFACALVRGSRPNMPEAPDFVNRWVSWGAGPRGVLTLVTAAKARAVLHGRYHATAGDVQAVAKPALRHRIAGNYSAQAQNIGTEQLIQMLLDALPADKVYERPAA